MAWKPGQRQAQRALELPYEGVPPHLRQPLWGWIEGGFVDRIFGLRTDRMTEIAIHLRLRLPPPSPLVSSLPLQTLEERCNASEEFMLDLVEAMLERFGWDDQRANVLNDLLTAANSAYAVKTSWDGLEERVASGVKEVIRGAVDAAGGSAGDHLTNAWNAAYGRNADPVKAYSESIKAVEAALAQRISPQNGKQTLGTMIRDVSAKPSKWTFRLASGTTHGVETVLMMMRLLWEGQTSRHGGLGPTRDETTEEARAAVHLAGALVQYGVSSAFDFV